MNKHRRTLSIFCVNRPSAKSKSDSKWIAIYMEWIIAMVMYQHFLVLFYSSKLWREHTQKDDDDNDNDVDNTTEWENGEKQRNFLVNCANVISLHKSKIRRGEKSSNESFMLLKSKWVYVCVKSNYMTLNLSEIYKQTARVIQNGK